MFSIKKLFFVPFSAALLFSSGCVSDRAGLEEPSKKLPQQQTFEDRLGKTRHRSRQSRTEHRAAAFAHFP